MQLKEQSSELCDRLNDELVSFSPGSRFYSVRQLMLRYRVSRRVIDAALAQLEQKGAIETRPQSGIYVKQNRLRKHVALLMPDWPSEGNKRIQQCLKEEFQNLSFENGVKVRLIASTTLNEPRENSIAAFSIIDMNYGYIYAEINENMFSDILSSESAVEITDKKGWSVKSSSFIDGKDYYETEIPSSSPIKIYYRLYMDKTPFSIFSFYGFTLFIILIFSYFINKE